jgi:HEAT repeat protein
MNNHALRLTDEEMRDFIINGYVKVKVDFPPSFHENVYEQLEAMFEQTGNLGNNVLPLIPEIQEIFDHPVVHGAMQGVLGSDYVMHSHRYCHYNPEGSDGQGFHKDTYEGDEQIRRHRCRWTMAFYYPQDVTQDMGPTGILPRMQYYNTISDTNPEKTVEQELPLCGQAGTVSLVNFDVWHRATPNRSEKKRHMLKFQFTRMEEPQAPTWHNEDPTWHPVDADPNPAVSRHVWDWLSANGTPDANGSESSAEASALMAILNDPATTESTRLDAAYRFGEIGEPAVAPLMERLREESEAFAEANIERTPANVQGGNPAELFSAHALSAVGAPAVSALRGALHEKHWSTRAAAADVLGNIGPAARDSAPAMIEILGDENVWVRRNAVEALGNIAPATLDAVPAVITTLSDTDERVRRNAAVTLAKMGQPANEAIPALMNCLNDEGRYVRYYAAVALRRITTPEAQQALWDAMLTSRWCALTTGDTPY